MTADTSLSCVCVCGKAFTLFLSLCSFPSVHSVPFTLFSSLCSFHSVPFTLFLSLCSFHSVPFTLYLSLCSFFSIPFTLFLSHFCWTKTQETRDVSPFHFLSRLFHLVWPWWGVLFLLFVLVLLCWLGFLFCGFCFGFGQTRYVMRFGS